MGRITKFLFLSSLPALRYVRDYEDAHLYVARNIKEWNSKLPNTDAVTFDNYIALRSEQECNDEKIIKHEYKHIQRIQKEGGELLFRPKLLFHMLFAWIATGDSSNNEYEREAQLAERS